jgi:hypothetical protein
LYAGLESVALRPRYGPLLDCAKNLCGLFSFDFIELGHRHAEVVGGLEPEELDSLRFRGSDCFTVVGTVLVQHFYTTWVNPNVSRLSEKPELIRSVGNLEVLNCFFNSSHGVGRLYNSYEQLHRKPSAEDAPSYFGLL